MSYTKGASCRLTKSDFITSSLIPLVSLLTILKLGLRLAGVTVITTSTSPFRAKRQVLISSSALKGAVAGKLINLLNSSWRMENVSDGYGLRVQSTLANNFIEVI